MANAIHHLENLWGKFGRRHLFWLLLSLMVPLYFGLVSLHYAFSQPYLVQDDARLHVVWLQQGVDAELFPQDRIAHYYQTIQAVGFKALYGGMAKLGIEPLILAKLLPTGLALITTGYLFDLTLLLLPHPACAFLTTLLLNQNIWLKDDLISATPRAFVYPLLVAFLYYLVRRSGFGCLTTLGLTGLFYPQLVLVQLGILTLRLLRQMVQAWRLGLAALGLAALGLAIFTVWPFQHSVAREFGGLLSAVQMQQMPEFGPQGRRPYFGVDPLSFWFRGASGVRLPLFPPILWLSLALPYLRHAGRLKPARPELRLLTEMALVSLALFLLAHLLFPRLYLPSRYTFYSFRVGMALAAGMVLFWGIGAAWRRWQAHTSRGTHSFTTNLMAGLALSFLIAVVSVPAVPVLFLSGQGWVSGSHPQLYRFLAAQPKDTVVATLTAEADNIPAFAQRSVLVSRELALAYHPVFYSEMQQRIVDLIQAQYSPNLATTQALLQHYHIDFLLLDRQFASPDYLAQQDWLIHSSFQPIVLKTIAELQQGTVPAVSQVIDRCTALSEKNLIILRAVCINHVSSG